MDNNLDLYFQTFIDTKMDEKEIIKWIKDFIKGKTVSIDAHIKNNFLDIQINSNEDYDEVRKMEKKSGFLFYPFYLDIFPSEKVNQNDYIAHIKELFFFLRGKNCTVVPACDFEDELNEELGCTLFVETKITEKGLVNRISNFLNGEKKFSDTILDEYMYLYIKHNDERDEQMKKHPIDGFLYYEYQLDVIPLATTSFPVYLKHLIEFIKFLRHQGYKVIPSCDYEDELNEGKSYTEWMK